MTNKKNPWVAAILNFILPGLGYLYLRRRKIFSILLILSIFIGLVGDLYFNPVATYGTFTILAGLLVLIGFSYDAYNEAKIIINHS